MSEARGVDIEIVDRNSTGVDVVLIEGQEICIPDDAPITISRLSHKDVATVTVTMMVRSLKINSEDKATKTRVFGGDTVHVKPA